MNTGFSTSILFFAFVLSSSNAYALRVPQKFQDANLSEKSTAKIYFHADQIESKKFIQMKTDEWNACHRKPSSRFAHTYDEDSLITFLGNVQPIRDLRMMEKQNLLQGQVETSPWSGDYWAYANGILGARYLDPQFMNLFDWHGRYEYIQNNPAPALVEKDGQTAVQTLSPSEKYELISGDSSSALTNFMWHEGKKYFDATGEVEGWMGICHGWAPAAIVEPRPTHAIDILSFDQKWQVHLRPSEIKGLVSYSWATNDFDSVSLGHRCNKKDPKRDENGRLIDPECFDLNPATWHLAVVNQVGIQSRSFVMDATYDYQVWNQPLVSYSYTYFNVKTGSEVGDLKKALVPRANFTKDKFAKYRSQVGKYLVGISMKVKYVMETSAHAQESDSEDNDAVTWVNYRYDLELDADGKIIGGEWYQEAHPDFIWTPRLGSQPRARLDASLSVEDWSDNNAIPAKWAKNARLSSQAGSVLNTITKALIIKANH